jgi:hypothetical protein
MSDAEVETKFRALAGRLLAGTQVQSALKVLWKVDELSDCGAVLEALAKR